MAEKNDVIIDVKVSGDKSISDASNSLKKYRQELKEAQAAALNGDGKAAKRVAELKDKMDDLRDSTKSLQGSGVEKVSSSFGLLGEGFRNFDFDKIKTGFSGVGAAMKAVPVFLLVEGITYLISNFDELSEGSGLLAKALRGIGELFTWVGDQVTKFTDAIGLSNSALEEQGEAIATNAEKSKEALNAQTAAYDRQIAVAKASGKSTVEIEKQKQEAIVQTNVTIARQIEAYVRAGGVLDDEKRKQLTASLEAIKAAKTQEQVIEITDQKTKAENYKKSLEEQLAAYNKSIDDRLKKDKELADYEEGQAKFRVDFFKAAGEEKKKIEDEELRVTTEEVLPGLQMGYEDHFEKRKETLRGFVLANHSAIQKTASLSQESLMATQNLSDTVFAIRMANVKKGSEEEEKLAKKQFQINKGLQLANAVINGAQAVTAILASPDFTPGIITGIRLASAAAATAAAIAKIATAQFNPSGGGDTSGGGSTAPTLAAPTTNIPTNAPTTAFTPPTNQTTRLNEAGEVIGNRVKAVVVETDITSKQHRVNRLENQATF